MVGIKCSLNESAVTITDLKNFQGGLKKRSTQDIDLLIASIKEDGLLMPFAIWNDCRLLDGHARFEALIKMALDDSTILTQSFPAIRIQADTEEDARKALLQITSSYGHVTKKGLVNFVSTIPNFKSTAPIVIKTIGVVPVAATSKPTKVDEDSVVLKVKVVKAMVERFTQVLGGVEGVTIL